MTSTAPTSTRFLVRKDKLETTELNSAPQRALAPGEVRLTVDAFALTSNNITYAAFGEAMQYWGFYPAPEVGDGGASATGCHAAVQRIEQDRLWHGVSTGATFGH